MGRGRDDYLFCRTDWFSVEESQKRSLQSEIDAISGNRLLNTSVDDLCDFFEEKFRIDVPELHEDQIVADQQETQIDVSQDPMRYIRDRSRPFHVAGTLVELTVPFPASRKLSRFNRRRTRPRHPAATFAVARLSSRSREPISTLSRSEPKSTRQLERSSSILIGSAVMRAGSMTKSVGSLTSESTGVARSCSPIRISLLISGSP